MARPTGFSILVTETDLAGVFARITELHGQTFDRSQTEILPAAASTTRNEKNSGGPTVIIEQLTTEKNVALQRVLDDVRDGLLGLVSRTEFDRFLDGLERENAVLSARHGHGHCRILYMADMKRNTTSGDAETCSGSHELPEDELRRWITSADSTAGRSWHGSQPASRCRVLMCGQPEWGGLKRADLPNIHSREGQIQTLVMVLEVCVRAFLAQSRQFLVKESSSSGESAVIMAKGDPAGSSTAVQHVLLESSSHPDTLARRRSSQERPLLVMIDCIDSFVSQETEHYVKKTIAVLKNISALASCDAVDSIYYGAASRKSRFEVSYGGSHF
ncbi:hypothetical protein MN608_02811 [Microdochium nivale]|nr:hypothetical protein MN608_02811 [Microdochium nivale]